jgi:hypothetical protein
MTKAAEAGNGKIIQMLLDHGANVKDEDENAQTPLHLAAGKGHQRAVRLLTSRGADPEAEDYDGETALHCAAGNGHETVVRLLEDHCKEHGIAISNSGLALAQEFLSRPKGRITCDNCDTRIPDSENHYHCSVCLDGDFDLCETCIDGGVTCGNENHGLFKRGVQGNDYINIGEEEQDLKNGTFTMAIQVHGTCTVIKYVNGNQVPVGEEETTAIINSHLLKEASKGQS